MKRLLVLNYEWPPLGGGASPVSEMIAAHLAATGEYSIDVITSGYKGLSTTEQHSPNLTIHRVPVWRKTVATSRVIEHILYLVLGFWRAQTLCATHHYDAVHAHFIIPTGALAWVLHGRYHIPYLLSCHGSDVLGYNERFTTLYRLLAWPWKKILNGARTITAPSQFLKEKILAAHPQLSAQQIEVIPHGVTPCPVTNITKQPIILTSGRLISHKHTRDIIEALATITEPWELHIAGDGPERSALEKLAAQRSVPVIFHGWLDKTGREYQSLLLKASIFVLQSRAESFSMAVAEAMSAGCAIITTQQSGAAELAGKAAITIPIGDVAALGTALEHLMGDRPLRTELQTQALMRIKEFTWERIIPRYQNLLATEKLAPHL